jgi:hypothetical protein
MPTLEGEEMSEVTDTEQIHAAMTIDDKIEARVRQIIVDAFNDTSFCENLLYIPPNGSNFVYALGGRLPMDSNFISRISSEIAKKLN